MIRLEVIGIPAPQGSKTWMPKIGAMVEGSSKTGREKLNSWRQAVTETALAWKDEHPDAEQLTGPVAVDVEFRFPPTVSNPYRMRHATKPDLDKLVRSVLDPLTNVGILRDDCLVWSISAEKLYVTNGEPAGATVFIQHHAAAEAQWVAERKAAAVAARRRAKGSA